VILVDSSVWIDHLRAGNPELATALEAGLVLTHPFVVGELACGNLANRNEILSALQNLSPAPVASHDEVLTFIEARSLTGRGIGYVDAHLLASATLANDGLLWTRDRRLHLLAEELALAYEPRS
jgi:predicted nucleic acid-binding protein